jgi:uncharacterized delta-60 repeat protein
VSRAARAVLEVLEDRRLMAAGSLDPTFGGGDGTFISEHPLVPTDMAVQPDGKILVSGFGLFDIGSVIRINPDGTKDASFGTNGLASSGHGPQTAIASAVAVGPTGRIAVVGMEQGSDPRDEPLATLILYSPQGKYLPVFGQPLASSDWGPPFTDVAFTPDGKILALGRKMVRFTGDGVVDTTFGVNGKKDISGKELIVLPDGKILVLGYFALFRFNPDGTPDTSFDGDGVVPNVKGNDIALAPDGDVLVAGNGPRANLVTRFNANGSIDTTFGSRGNVAIPGAAAGFGASELAITANNIFVGATAHNFPYSSLEFTALTHTGQLDTANFTGGQWVSPFGGTSHVLEDMAIQQGKLVALSQAEVQVNDPPGATEIRPGLMRFLLNGTPPPPAQTPFSGTPITLPGPIEVENFDKGGEGVAYHDTEPANLGNAYRTGEGVDIQELNVPDPNGQFYVGFVKAGEWLEYTVTVDRTGVFDLAVTASHLRTGGQFHFELDGQRLGPNLTVPQTGDWIHFADVTQRVTLPAGQHVLRLAFDTNGAIGYVGNFDRIRVIPTFAPQSPFKGVPFKPGERVQAEDFDAGGQDTAYHDNDPQNIGGAYRPNEGVDIEPTSDAGGGYNVGWLRAGEWLEYTFDFPEAGSYDLLLRYAKLKAGGSFLITIGTVQSSGDLGQSTGSWQTYTTRTLPSIPIPAGQQTLRIQIVSADPTGYAMNLNWLEFRKQQ